MAAGEETKRAGGCTRGTCRAAPAAAWVRGCCRQPHWRAGLRCWATVGKLRGLCDNHCKTGCVRLPFFLSFSTSYSVGVCSWPANYEALAQSHLTGKVMKLAHNLWAMVSSPSLPSSPLSPPPVTQVKEKMSKVVIRHLFQALIHSVACLHSMLDPQRAWKECFLPASLASTGGKEGPSVLPAPAELVPLFVSVLTQSQVPLHFNLCLQLYSDLRNELLHMIGALLSSVEVMKSSHYFCVSKVIYTEQCTKRSLIKCVSTTTDLSRPPRKHLPASGSCRFHGDQGHPRTPLSRP